MNERLREALSEGRPVKVPPLAEALEMSRNGLYEAIKRGEIPSTRVGRAIRVPAYAARRLLGLDQPEAA